ncbi:MAG: hypothetical protein HQM10_14540 [Candidatus Riflebacteria bacterium]|nr:hypothetical protein [Candidatus Riflebacteria bacterium]
MNEEIEFLKMIATRLDSIGIPYMITGSTAMHFYSTPRMTRDIDIVVAVRAENIGELTDLFSGDCYVDSESIRRAVANTGMFNIIHNKWILKADFIIRKNEEYRIEEFKRRSCIKIDDVPIQIVTIEDLILSKLLWGQPSNSELQMRDVKNLLSNHHSVDMSYLLSWASALGVTELLDEALRNE